MPYDPHESYIGPQLLAQGIGQFGQAVGGGLSDYFKKREEIRQKLGEADALYQFGHKQGFITPEEDTKYIQANANQKADMAAGWAKRMALEQANQQFQEEKAYHAASLANAIKVAQIAAASREGGGVASYTPEQFTQAQAAAEQAGYKAIPIPTRGGGVSAQFLPYKTDGGADELSADPSTFKAQQVEGTGTSQQNPPQYMTTFADAQGKRHIARNAMIQGVPKAQDPFMAAVMGQMFGGGGAGGGTFNVTPNAPAVATPTPLPATPTPTAIPLSVPMGAATPPALNPQDQQAAAIQALAQQALNDPNATPEHKAAARKILGL